LSPASSPDAAPAIEVRGVVNAFEGRVVHDGVNLVVRKGEVMGLVGGSGAGKTVLLNTIIGLQQPVAGEVRVLGHNAATMSVDEHRELEKRWGVLFQSGALFSALNVRDNVAAPLIEHTNLSNAFSARVADLKIAMVGLPPEARLLKPAELSGGMRKRAGLARALALDPEVLFLDEPTAGLDPIGAAAFDQLIRELASNLGLTVLMVTHDLDSLYAVCDRVAVLADRKIVAVDRIAELEKSPHPWIREYFLGPRGRAAARGAL
jgi:phospholipid/cholesterol/gamma-HCH transport system ATP-binding protein